MEASAQPLPAGAVSPAPATAPTDRAKSERKPRLHAVRAGGDRDAARDRLSDHLRDHPVAAALRPALSQPAHASSG